MKFIMTINNYALKSRCFVFTTISRTCGNCIEMSRRMYRVASDRIMWPLCQGLSLYMVWTVGEDKTRDNPIRLNQPLAISQHESTAEGRNQYPLSTNSTF